MARRRSTVLTPKAERPAPPGSLEDVLRSRTVLSVERIVRILDDLAGALDNAHRMGLVYGDVTPGNILIDRQGRAHLANLHAQPPGAVEPGARGGRSGDHSAYQPPEQWRRQPSDGRADQYALAVITYELLTGQRRSDAPVVHGIQTLEPVEVFTDVPLRHGVGLHVNAALRRALSASPANRFPTVGAFVDALAGREPTEAPTPRRPRFYRSLRRPRAASVATVIVAAAVALIAVDARVRTDLEHAWRALWVHMEWLSGIGGVIRPPGPVSVPFGTGPTGSHGVSAGPTTIAGAPPALPTSAPAIRTSAAAPVPTRPVGSWAARLATALGISAASPAPPPAIGFIAVTVNGGSALVIIDGIPRGTSPYLGEATVGRHSVSVRNWNHVYRPPRMVVTVTQRDTARVTWRAPSE